jgi:vitamin B12/bleomycin/antimicrobial peptide transport system ATP-binding/permease protein
VKELNRQVWQRFVKVARPFWFSDDKKAARGLLLVLLLFMIAVNGLNVVINYVGGNFMTALSSKDVPTFYRMLFIYGGVFVVGTPVVVFYSWVQSKLGVRWRKWLTEHLLSKYLSNRNFYRLSHHSEIDNPDERLHQDVNSFCSTALSLTLVGLSSIVTFFSFAGILWSIYKPLCLVLIVYSIGGTIATIFCGRPLIGLNFNQLRKEADFRYGLVHLRKNVESIAFYQGEDQEGFQIRRRFAEAIKNFNALIGWQRNLGFLTTGYNYFVVIIPSMVIAPLFFAGKVKFGVITQADMAFGQVLAALSVIVTSFSDISGFIAVTNRLGSFVEALDDQPAANESQISTENGAALSLIDVTVATPDKHQVLVRDLSLKLEKGQGLLIMGVSGAGKSSVLRTIAGLWTSGEGTIRRPALTEMMFLPQRPYMSLGTLRSQLLYPNAGVNVSDAVLLDILKEVNLGNLVDNVGGLDAEREWSEFLSVGEQQRLSFARILVHSPNYVVLDEATSGLDVANEERLYGLLKSSCTTYISVGHRSSLMQHHASALELQGHGSWSLSPSSDQSLNRYPAFFNAAESGAVLPPTV